MIDEKLTFRIELFHWNRDEIESWDMLSLVDKDGHRITFFRYDIDDIMRLLRVEKHRKKKEI